MSMTTVDFYLVTSPSITECYRFICQLVDKAYQQKHNVYIHVNSADEAKLLDNLLWTFRDDSFMPHNIIEENVPPTVPIQLGYHLTPHYHSDILLNLTIDIPPFFSQFQRILEIVPSAPDARAISRKKYRSYRDHGCQIASHELNKTS